jgi:hypothetical protein
VRATLHNEASTRTVWPSNRVRGNLFDDRCRPRVKDKPLGGLSAVFKYSAAQPPLKGL